MHRLLETIGRRVRAARGDETQASFATRAGIQQPTLSRVECGNSSTGPELVLAICGALGCDPNWLLTGRGRKPRRVKAGG